MKEVHRIIRVDHAGELGAINIYRSQLMVAKLFYKDIVPELEDMLAHEREHYIIFDRLLSSRNIRHCYALSLWAIGGLLLGLSTAMCGRNAIWVCTHSIESTVLHHLEWQLDYLQKNDSEAYHAVLSIKSDEEQHQNIAESKGAASVIYQPIFYIVRKSTELAIWLSTKL